MAKQNCSKKDKTETIKQKAYELWANDGRKDNCDLQYWLEAEQAINIKTKKR
jgi:hypothetical protein